MKKIIILILLLLTMVLSPLSALAAQWPDSLTIDSETREILGVDEDTEVMRFYSSSFFMHSFSRGYSIDEILANMDKDAYVSYVYPNDDFKELDGSDEDYVTFGPSSGFTAREIEDGVAEEKSQRSYYDSCREFYNLGEKQEQILGTIGENVVAEKVYYLKNSYYAPTDLFVYYVTNIGDYVYFSTEEGTVVGEPRTEYLFPLSEFQYYAECFVEMREGMIYGTGAVENAVMPMPKGLAAYKLEFPEQNIIRDILLWSIPVVVILTAGGLWFFLRWKKKEA